MPRASFFAAAAACAFALAWAEAAPACTISTTGVAFGTYDPTAATADDGVGSVTLDCAKNQRNAVVAIGTGGGGSYSNRRMTGTATNLPYNLYTNSGRTIVWGNGSSGTSTVTVQGGITALTVYGRIPPQQNVRAGSYSDSVVVTVTF